MSRVLLDHISKSYGALKVIEEVTLEVPHGQFLAILGPSGCGKSTLLRIIAGLADQTAGRVVIGDRDVSELSPARRGVSMVFQSYALYPHLSVEGNLSLGLKRAHLPREEIARRVTEATRVLQLETLLKRRPSQLSGGQRQRVAIGRAIVREPEAFLFDEPLSNLDAALRMQVRSELADLHQRLGATMIYVTHDQVEAMTLAQRIVVMNSGVVQQVGTPQELYRTPANLFVAGFIGAPTMNLLTGRTTANGIDIAGVAHIGWSGPAGRQVMVGVRPSEFGSPASNGEGFAATIQASEYLGSESILRARLADGTLVQVIERPDHGWKAGDTVHLPVETFHVFDMETRQRIGGSSDKRQAA